MESKIKQLKTYASFEDVKDNHRIKESMFPPPKAEKMNLHYSMRILPHDQNSGGFFVALLKKQENFEWLYDTKKNSKMVDEGEEKNEEQREEDFLRSNMPEVENAVALEDEGQKEKEEKEFDEEVEEEEGEPKIEEENVGLQTIKDKKSKESLKYERFENISEEEFESIQKFYALDPSLRELLYVREIDGTARRKVLLVS